MARPGTEPVGQPVEPVADGVDGPVRPDAAEQLGQVRFGQGSVGSVVLVGECSSQVPELNSQQWVDRLLVERLDKLGLEGPQWTRPAQAGAPLQRIVGDRRELVGALGSARVAEQAGDGAEGT